MGSLAYSTPFHPQLLQRPNECPGLPFLARAEQDHPAILALEVVELCGLQPIDDPRTGWRHHRFEQAVGDIAGQALNEGGGEVVCRECSLFSPLLTS